MEKEINIGLPGSSTYEDVHKKCIKEIKFEEEKNIKKTREEICSRYDIPKKNVIIEPFFKGLQRKYRIFVIFKQISTDTRYYAEGSTSHMELNNKIIERHNKTNKENKFLTIEEIKQLLNSDDGRNKFEQKYEIRKGFIDSSAKGFENSDDIRFIFKKTQEEIRKQKKDQDAELDNGVLNDENFPNWFLVKQSSK